MTGLLEGVGELDVSVSWTAVQHCFDADGCPDFDGWTSAVYVASLGGLPHG